eukprot:4434117-Pyramimonas_sp.AAC.1
MGFLGLARQAGPSHPGAAGRLAGLPRRDGAGEARVGHGLLLRRRRAGVMERPAAMGPGAPPRR